MFAEGNKYKIIYVQPQKSQGKRFKLALQNVIGSSATTVTPCHSEIRDAKMTQPFQFFYGSITNQKKKPLSLHG